METIKVVGVLPYLVKNLAFGNFEKTTLANLSRQGRRITYPSGLDGLVRRCASLLSLTVLPGTFVVEEGQLNAFTFEAEKHPVLVVDSGLLNLLTPREVMAVVGHELGHVKSGHMLYHTLGEILSGGISLSASLLGLSVVSIPLRFTLLSWHRESEVTADRASLLVVKDIGVIKSMMTKLTRFPAHAGASSKNLDIEKDETGALESVSELFTTHPLFANRFRLVKEFAESEEFVIARRKIELRQTLLKAFVPLCRYCGAKKRTGDAFCPRCGRCQT